MLSSGCASCAANSMRGLSQGALDSPAAAEYSAFQGTICQTDEFCPFGHRTSDAIKSQEYSCAPIPHLHDARAPDNVTDSIGAIIVKALQRMLFRWSWAHIGVERREICAPSVAHRDAASTVVRIEFVGRRHTSLEHVHPDIVFGCSSHAVFDFPASARIALPAKSVKTDKPLNAALTAAQAGISSATLSSRSGKD